MSSDEAKISIIIVNWRSFVLLRECLRSLLNEPDAIRLIREIIIINNSKERESVEPILDARVSLKMLTNIENVGFGRACNQGVTFATAEFLLFLNPDTKITSRVLQAALAFLVSPDNSSYAACGIKLRDEHGNVARSCTRFPSTFSFSHNALGIQRIFPWISDRFHMMDWQHDEDRDVQHIIGAFYFIRTSIFRNLGGFDERYFVYLEDLDLSLRLAEAGFKIRYIASIDGMHIGGGSSSKALASRLYYSLSSRLRYSRKNHSVLGFMWVSFLTLSIEPMIRIVRACLAAGPLALRDVVKAYIWLWFDFMRTGAGKTAARPR